MTAVASPWSAARRRARRRPLRASPWRQDVARRADLLEVELDRVPDDMVPGSHVERARLRDLLEVAREAARAPAGPLLWWSGAAVERAWGALREVEERLPEFVPSSELDVWSADAMAHARFAPLERDDPRVSLLETLRLERSKHRAAADHTYSASDSELRAALTHVLRAAHARMTVVHQDARALRNRLLAATTATVVFAAALIRLQASVPHDAFVPVPGDWEGSAWQLLGLVMVFGALGALVTAVRMIARVPTDHSPFNLPLQQALVKLAVGAMTAVVGLVVLDQVGGTGSVTVTAPGSLTGTALAAVLFGAGQHLVTRFVDQRARDILADTDHTSSGGTR